MTHVLIYKKTGEWIKTYSTQKGARIGLRASKKNAGWTGCISRCWSGIVECEWAQHEQSDVYDYAPYAIAQEFTWQEWLANRQTAHSNVVFG